MNRITIIIQQYNLDDIFTLMDLWHTHPYNNKHVRLPSYYHLISRVDDPNY